MSRFVKVLMGLATSVLILVGGISSAAPASAASTGTQYICHVAVTDYNWAGKSPKSCSGTYTIFSNGKVIMHVDNRGTTNWSALWSHVKAGYQAAQNWCASNSLTCTIITSAGVAVAASLLG